MNTSPKFNTIILGANGSVANLLLTMLKTLNTTIIGVDIKEEPCFIFSKYYQIDLAHQTLNNNHFLSELKDADCIISCLPEQTAISALSFFWPYLKNKAILIDTLSAKKVYFESLAKIQNTANKQIYVLSIHPLFKPTLGFKDNNLAIIQHNGNDYGEIGTNIISCLSNIGANLIYCTADEHDKIMSIVQVLTHAVLFTFSIALSKSDYKYENLKNFLTPPHRILLSLLARITSNSPQAYWDIQHNNHYADNIRKNLYDGIKELTTILSSNDANSFYNLINNIKCFFGNNESTLDKFSALIDNCNFIDNNSDR